MPTKHLLIKGKVQGVFYRAKAKEVAENIGITGWIKNTNAGDVEAVINGTDKMVDAFIAWCRRGPSKAFVKDVIVKEKEEKAFENFAIVRD